MRELEGVLSRLIMDPINLDHRTTKMFRDFMATDGARQLRRGSSVRLELGKPKHSELGKRLKKITSHISFKDPLGPKFKLRIGGVNAEVAVGLYGEWSFSKNPFKPTGGGFKLTIPIN